MVGTTKPFGQSSNNNAFCPRTQSVFGQNNNIISNQSAPNPFDASTPFGAPQASSSLFGASSQEFESSTPAFGASSDPAFGSSPSPFGATSAFGQNSFVVSSPQTSPSRSTTQQSQPAFVHSTVGPCKPFGASKTSALGASSTPAFGGSSTPSFGTTNSPGFGTSPSQAFGSGGAFGAPNTSEFGASSTPSFSFGSSPAFGSGSFGSGSFASTHDPFGAQGTVMLYPLTTEVDSGTSNSQPVGKIQSIFALHVHKDKCHEELRWEDYQRVDKGGQRSSGQSPGGATFGVTNPQPNLFSQTSSSPTSTNPFGSTSTSHFGKNSPTPTSNFPLPFGQDTNPSVFGQTPSCTISGFGSSPVFATTTSQPIGSSSTHRDTDDESVAKRISRIRLRSSSTPTINQREDEETSDSDEMSVDSSESSDDDDDFDDMSDYSGDSSDDDDDDDDDDLMRGVRRSTIMKNLTPEYRRRLKNQLSLSISRKHAKKLLSVDRFRYVLEKIKQGEPLRLFDNSEYVILFWEPNKISEEYVLPNESGENLKKVAGYFREQEHHDNCWCYALADMVSASLVLHGHQAQYIPLCVRFLLQNVDKEKYRDMHVFRDGAWHRCYGTDMETGLAYVKRHGIPKELPNQGNIIDCCEKRFLKEDEEYFKISKILKYTTLEQALVRLRTHPVAANLIAFEGYTGSEIYRGPVGGHDFIGYHSVLLLHCLRIDGELVILGKMNNGDDVGVEGHKGCVAVSLGVMVTFAGIRRAEKNKGCRMFHVKPTYLLTDFYSVDMEYKNPMHFDPAKEIENKNFEVKDSKRYAWMDDKFPDFPLKKKKKKSHKRVMCTLHGLEEDRVEKSNCWLPSEDINKQSTVVQITFPSEPPVVREYDWAKNDLDEFTNDLIIDDALPLHKKDEFKEFVKTQCDNAKKTNEEKP